MIWTIKCRDCQFKTTDIKEMHEHITQLKHMNFSLLAGNEVKIDWIHIETKIEREEPS